MEAKEYKKGEKTIVEISGRLDATSSPVIQEQLMQIIDREKSIILDCTHVEFISSSGLRVFLMAAKKLKGGNGSLVICALSENVKEVFDISGLSSILTLIPTMEEALKI